MKSWYQSYHLIKYISLQMIFMLFFYLEVIRYGQPQDMSYIYRYLEGIYVIFLVLTYTFLSHHRHLHIMLYLGKRVHNVLIKHIVSDVWIIMYMLGIIMTHFSFFIVFQLPILYIELLLIITIQYTILTLIIFQISDHFMMRLSVQLIAYMAFIYADLIKILKPFIWFETYHMHTYNSIYACILILILIVIRYIKYHFIRVRP